MNEKETKNKKIKRKRNKIHSVLCIITITAVLCTILVLPSFALEGGGTTDVTDLYTTMFPSAVLEQIYTDKNNTSTVIQYENQFSLPIPLRTLQRYDGGYGIFVPNYNGNNQTGIQTNYTVTRVLPNDNQYGETFYNTDYSLNIAPTRYNMGMPPPSYYDTSNGYFNLYLGDYNGIDSPLGDDILATQYRINLRYLVHDNAYIDYDGYDFTDQSHEVYIYYDTYEVVNGVVTADEHTIRLLVGNSDYPIGHVDTYNIYDGDNLYPLHEIFLDIGEYVPVGNIRVSYTSNRYTPDGLLVSQPITDVDTVLTYGLTVKSLMIPFDAFNPPIIVSGGGSFVDSSFNPIDWVVNVGETFLSMALFNTVGGVPVTIGVLFGAIVVTFSVLAILKLYWGG